jgi:FkbM family methyltransferase
MDKIITLENGTISLQYPLADDILEAFICGWRYDDSCYCWIKNGIRFKEIRGPILDVFEYEEYKALNVKDRTVVDVGAYVGDSAIYFALRGARKIIAVEPHQEAFKEMLENVKLNKFANIIIPVNAGLASKPGNICVEEDNIIYTAYRYHKHGECSNTVPAITLDELINKYNIDRDAVLKMDCEGCEYDVILNDYEHIKHFKEIIFEYHGDVSKLLKVLTRNYKCTFIRRGKCLGLVRCVRMTS